MSNALGAAAEEMPPGLENSRPVFDRATRLARALFGQVEAQITLVTPESVWRSRRNERDLGAAAGVREVIRSGELLWLEDCRLDPRFRDDPLVRGLPGPLFYAGAPIRLEDLRYWSVDWQEAYVSPEAVQLRVRRGGRP